MTLIEYEGCSKKKIEFNSRKELDAYVLNKYPEIKEFYYDVPDTYESVHTEELSEARKYDELAGYYDEYSYGYWIE